MELRRFVAIVRVAIAALGVAAVVLLIVTSFISEGAVDCVNYTDLGLHR